MDRRLVAGIATAAAMVMLVLAASSSPVRLWITPPSEVAPPSINTSGPLATVAPPDLVPPDRIPGQWDDTLLQVLGVLLLVIAVTTAYWLVKSGLWPRPGRRRVHWRWGHGIVALPEVSERELAVDVDAARDALAGGTPRNAIVACWMQLERDVAAAGLPREASETSAEYVERVVMASSVEPQPIRALAALYREARFSRHELGDEHRARAFAALNRVEAALRRSVEMAT